MANSSRTFLLYFISPSMGSREGEQSSGLKKKLVYNENGTENIIRTPEVGRLHSIEKIIYSLN